MIAVHIVPKDIWEAKLRKLGCSRVFERNSGVLLSPEVWQTKEGRWFTFPVEDGECAQKKPPSKE